MKKKILIIGGGASGMVAAIVAARRGGDIVLIEQNNELGKKILATGNGRCNYTNLSMSIEDYYCSDTKLIETIIEKYPPQVILDFFESLGILWKERNGYVYPFTDQATSIRQALVNELAHLNVKIEVNSTVKEIKKSNSTHKTQYLVNTDTKSFTCDTVILATGGKSGLGKHISEDGFALIHQTKHRLTTLSPALVALKGEGKFYKKLSGLRTDASVSAMVDGNRLRTETGELQWTDYGISGIPVFQISRIITQELIKKSNASLAVEIDFLPTFSDDKVLEIFKNRQLTFATRTMHTFMNGLFKDKLGSFLLYTARIEEDRVVSDVTSEEMQKLVRICKTFSVKINGTKEFQNSQVTAGGVPLDEVTLSLESKFHSQMFFTGELLDVDGICGGYNLHFAWATGMLVGEKCTSL